ETFRSPAGLVKKIDILPSPAAPAVKANDITNTVTGIAKTMEFSKDGGTTWAKYASAASLGDMNGNITLLVRKSGVRVTMPGAITTLEFTELEVNADLNKALGEARGSSDT
ncbi:hypothetical protein, partial [Paenibacillus sp. YIM B09110]|uniref:hypothetical protein n=1 Tax=Paenibacillus sp. YIM B09110 TaxID=3126102 RepID=UPI00301D4F78